MNPALSPADRERLEDLFDRAAELPPAERIAFAERECGSNEALRRELRRLLEGLSGDDVLGTIQGGAPSRAGTRIGSYTLLERIGEGGMGEVYAAEQVEPVRRRVAIKIIKPGMDSAQVVLRFEAERQALARMEHPYIARVYDGGTTGDGRPYFVMEYVDGVPLTEFCDQQRLTTRERLELFLDICGGVQHAHQKGIIHRDLKPSNLLVTREDGRPTPKIIDFGVARATTGHLTERSLHTHLGQIIGTLDYMSPEQADPTSADIDTRSDVYSLGIVLYQLLSGFLPFDHSSSPELLLSEIQRRIREQDPPTPSTRLRRERGTATALAPLRKTNQGTWIRQLTGDLDWMCMKALEKDPARRYASAADLAADIRRHLAHEPVLAGPPRPLYRASKFVRRHRVGVSAAILIAAAVSVGFVGVAAGRMDALAAEQRRKALEPQVDAFAASRLLREAESLWPVSVANIPRFERWIAEASALATKRARYAEGLERLAARALPWTDDDRQRDRMETPDLECLVPMEAELEWLRTRLAGIAPEKENNRREVERQITAVQAALDRLVEAAETRRSWRFESSADSAAHDVLVRLHGDLERIGDESRGLLATEGVTFGVGWGVPRRLAFARRLEQEFAAGGDAQRAWTEALRQIPERYPGLDLKVQPDLVPLGPDPVTGLWEFALLTSGEPAVRDATGKLVLSPESGIVLVLIPEGGFWMGSQRESRELPCFYDGPVPVEDGESGLDKRALRVERVDAFFLSKFETTQAQWQRFVGENPANEQASSGLVRGPLLPVNSVSWTDCNKVAKQLGLTLPTEQQWEYAARAGTDTPWWTGGDAESLACIENVFDLSSHYRFRDWATKVGISPAQWEDGWPVIDRVDGRIGNPWGLHDMLGNVAEWCQNMPYLYGTTPGVAPETRRIRVARGGDARSPVEHCRSASRRDGPVGMALPSLGVRFAREVR